MVKPKINTMEELAVTIGVSRPTLSRYFQDPAKVSQTSVQRIQAGLARVDYTPNFFATRMNRKSTRMIGVIIPYRNDLFFSRLVDTIERVAMDAGYTVITQCSQSNTQLEASVAETFLSMCVDGILVAPLGNCEEQDVYERLSAKLPVVLMHTRPKQPCTVDFVGTDHAQSTGVITEYLCRVGKPPVFLDLPTRSTAHGERRLAYEVKMRQLGHIPVVIGADAAPGGDDFEAYGLNVMCAHFAKGHYVEDTILCVNDRVAIGALRAAALHGLEPGAQRRGGLRIAGHDDNPLCAFLAPALTTVSQDNIGIGQAAMERLIEKISADCTACDQMVKLFDGTLQVRESA